VGREETVAGAPSGRRTARDHRCQPDLAIHARHARAEGTTLYKVPSPAAAIRAIVKTHAALRTNVELATEVGRKLFPPSEAALVGELIRRDLPYYDASISRDFVAGMNQFARDVGILKGQGPYESVVAARFSDLWAA